MPARSEAGPVEAIVCVPARNEAERIGRLLRSLAAQSVTRAAHPLKVVVAINNSTDATAEIVRGVADDPRLSIRQIEVILPPDQAHAGMARRLAMDAGADWLREMMIAEGVLISTDADAIAPKAWVASNLAALARADLVGGRLIIAGDGDAALMPVHARIERYWAAVRALEDRIDPPSHDPPPRHGDHTGASLALRASLYRAVGGVPPIASGEDNALVSAVERSGGRIRHCPDVWIEVSAREFGRAEGGMACEMVRRREALAGATSYLLPSAAFWRTRLEQRARWRAEWPVQGAAYGNAIAYVAHRQACAPSPHADDLPIDDAIAALGSLLDSAFV